MEFTHEPGSLEETIAACATAPGDGGVAIIRISGKKSFEIGQKLTKKNLYNKRSHEAFFNKVFKEDGTSVDEALFLPFRSPKSFTGEDVLEIHCHGGRLITKKVLETVLKAGARHARPGEFTLRAFLNGKMDLAEAEAVQSLIAAKNERALKAASQQLRGALSEKIRRFQKKLTHIAAILEAWVDFPEEGLEFATEEEIIALLEEILDEMQRFLSTYSEGKRVRDGHIVCLAGAPNVGKSSLLNALIGKKRAIVSDIPGTTRDTIEEEWRLSGWNLSLIDTAGIRKSDDIVEQEGIKRTKEALSETDLVLFVLDSSRPLGEEEIKSLLSCNKEKTVLVYNKTDLASPEFCNTAKAFPYKSLVSAREEKGLLELKKTIEHLLDSGAASSKEEVLLTSERHFEALLEASNYLEKLLENFKNGISPEFLNEDMRSALLALGRIIGRNVTEDILTEIFSTFCIGK